MATFYKEVEVDLDIVEFLDEVSLTDIIEHLGTLRGAYGRDTVQEVLGAVDDDDIQAYAISVLGLHDKPFEHRLVVAAADMATKAPALRGELVRTAMPYFLADKPMRVAVFAAIAEWVVRHD